MKGLLIKDLYYLKRNARMFLILTLMSAVIGTTGGSGSFVIGYMTMFFTIQCANNLAMDEQDGGYAYLMTLPISRRAYVYSKYILGILMAVAGLVVGGLICLMLVRDPMADVIPTIGLGMLPLSLLLLSTMMPVMLRFGREKGYYVFLGIYGTLFAGIFILAKLEVLDHLGEALAGVSMTMAAVVIWAAVLGILLISMAFSVKIMEEKEF